MLEDYITKPGLYVTVRKVCNRLVNHRSCLPDGKGTSSQVLPGSVPKTIQSNKFLNDSDGAVATLVKLETYSSMRAIVNTPEHFPEFKRLLKN